MPVETTPRRAVLGRRALPAVLILLAAGLGALAPDRRRKFVPCPKCGEKVRLEADGWGQCFDCDIEFEFKGK
jgi:phage terminase large subunit GpA-like protein